MAKRKPGTAVLLDLESRNPRLVDFKAGDVSQSGTKYQLKFELTGISVEDALQMPRPKTAAAFIEELAEGCEGKAVDDITFKRNYCGVACALWDGERELSFDDCALKSSPPPRLTGIGKSKIPTLKWTLETIIEDEDLATLAKFYCSDDLHMTMTSAAGVVELAS